MLILALNTAGPACDVAIIADGQTLTEQREAMVRGQDAHLPRLVQQACAESSVRIADIDRFAVVTGPGSFTGIRIGIAFARGLALATGAPCLGISCLQATLPDTLSGPAMVILPAQKRPPAVTFWAQTFDRNAATGMITEWPLSKLADHLKAQSLTVYGNAGDLSCSDFGLVMCRAEPTARKAGQQAACLDPAQHLPRPLYVRPPDVTRPAHKICE